jgi:hypothetical protein
MTRIGEGLALLDSYAGSAIRPGSPSDDALITLLVWMATSDGHLDDDELEMLDAVLGLGLDATRAHVFAIRREPLHLDALAAALDTDDRRWTTLRFAARMAGKDRSVAPAERKLLDELAAAFALGAGAVDRALSEIDGPPRDRLDAEVLRQIITSLAWDAAIFADGPVESEDLLPAVPAGATPVLRIGVDQTEVLGVYVEGLVGRFLEGPAFLTWSEIVACHGGIGLESSVRLITESGRIWSVVDSRLAGVARLIDRLHRPDPAPPRPVLVQRVVAGATWDDSSR